MVLAPAVIPYVLRPRGAARADIRRGGFQRSAQHLFTDRLLRRTRRNRDRLLRDFLSAAA